VHIQSNIAQQQKMLYLKGKLKQLNHIIGSKKICYLDLPIHSNVGDLLIMQGTLSFFMANGFSSKYYLTVHNYFSQAIQDDDVIVFHGGGNFGDLYRVHQQFREDIVARYSRHKIVILPQTIYFKEEKEFDKTCELLSKHKNLHICVRDHHSFLLAEKMTPNVYLLPDMAHQLYPMQSLNQEVTNTNKSLYIKRTDKESCDENYKIKADAVGDWNNILGRHRYVINFFVRLQLALNYLKLNRYTGRVTSFFWLKYVKYIINNVVVHEIASFDLLYTSRLHGFIFANLLNKDTHLIDNNYGKNKQYFQTWMKSR
jgi:pyruvyl transferase EpsO